jgi:hypothetical protein
VLSDVVHGEVIGLRQDRSEATATTPGSDHAPAIGITAV